ncbi:MAG: hypothetical protein ACTHM5_01060 [Ginsengibacter sp.]
MSLQFPRINLAINWTISYYSIPRIEAEFQLLSGTGFGYANRKKVQETYELVLLVQKDMEGEITQTIQTCTPATQILLFDYLNDWLSDYRIERANREEVYREIEMYNIGLYEKFLKEVEEKETEFKSTFYYGLDIGAEYKIEKYVSTGILTHGVKNIVTERNKKFFCLNTSPEYIDLQFIDLYMERLNKLVSNFRMILKKYVDLYKIGKLPVSNAITLAAIKEDAKFKELPTPLTSLNKKLKTTLTVPQIGFLFKMLYDAGIIKSGTFKDIQVFISKNFSVESKADNEDISSKKLQKLWNDFDVETASFWSGKFIELRNLSKQHNPNNIKTNR